MRTPYSHKQCLHQQFPNSLSQNKDAEIGEGWEALLALLSLLFSIMLLVSTSVEAQLQFQEVTEAAGIPIAEVRSYSAAWGDFDRNGCPDLYVTNHTNPPSLYLNRCDGTFQNVTAQVRPRVAGQDKHGVAWCDIDNDGDLDLIELTGALLGAGAVPKHLFINDGGRFHEEAALRGIHYDEGRGRMPACLDYNRDGRLDFLFSSAWRPDGMAPTALFKQNLDGSFRNVTLTVGINLPGTSQSFSQLSTLGRKRWFLLLFGPEGPQVIYAMKPRPFKDVRQELGVPLTSNVRDAAIADFDGDGAMDLLLCRQAAGVRLLLNRRSGFLDATTESGLAGVKNCNAVATADFDNDMDADIYLVRSIGRSNLPNMLWQNQGLGTFVQALDAGGAQGTNLGRGDFVAVADYDLDGFLDLFVGNGSQRELGPYQLFHNLGNNNHSIQLDLQGTRSNRDGIGTHIMLTAGGKAQVREHGGGMHYGAQDHTRIHFGLGANSTVSRLVITWPSGIVQTLTNIHVDQILRVIEPSTP